LWRGSESCVTSSALSSQGMLTEREGSVQLTSSLILLVLPKSKILFSIQKWADLNWLAQGGQLYWVLPLQYGFPGRSHYFLWCLDVFNYFEEEKRPVFGGFSIEKRSRSEEGVPLSPSLLGSETKSSFSFEILPTRGYRYLSLLSLRWPCPQSTRTLLRRESCSERTDTRRFSWKTSWATTLWTTTKASNWCRCYLTFCRLRRLGDEEPE